MNTQFKAINQLDGEVRTVNETDIGLYDLRIWDIYPIGQAIVSAPYAPYVRADIAQKSYDESGSRYRELSVPVTTPGLKISTANRFIKYYS